MKTVARSLLSLVLGITCTSAVMANNWIALDRSAVQLENHAQAVMREIQVSFRHTASYPALISKAGQLTQHANQFHALVDSHANRQTLDRTLRCVDNVFSDVEDCVFDAGREARWNRQCQVDTRRAEQLLKCVDNTIIQLENIVDDLRDCDYRPTMPMPQFNQRPIINNPYPAYQGPDYGNDYSYGPNTGTSYRPNYDAHRPSYGSQPGGFNNPRPGISFGPNGLTLGNGFSIGFGR